MMQDAAWAVTMLLMAGTALVFAWVATAGERPAADYHPAVAAAYRLHPWLFAGLSVVLVAVNLRALEALPYLSRPGLGAPQQVSVVGEQWSWTISPKTVAIGRPVEFHVTSKDVNHGFAVYDPGLRLVAQTQAMPHYVNVLRYTFPTPGTYRVLCLEYCGVAHHLMAAEITAVAR